MDLAKRRLLKVKKSLQTGGNDLVGGLNFRPLFQENTGNSMLLTDRKGPLLTRALKVQIRKKNGFLSPLPALPIIINEFNSISF